MLVGVGASVFVIGPASSGPFGGSDSPTCGAGLDCTSDTFTAADATGPGFVCNSLLTTCLDPGPGVNNGIGTDASGRLVLCSGAQSACTVYVGPDGQINITSNGNLTVTNGAVIVNGTTFFVNQNGTDPVRVTDTHGFQINGGTAITKRLLSTAALDFGSIAASATATLTATVTGAAAGDHVTVTRCTGLEATIGDLQPWVSAADTVSLKVRNFDTGSAVDPASCAFVFEVTK